MTRIAIAVLVTALPLGELPGQKLTVDVISASTIKIQTASLPANTVLKSGDGLTDQYSSFRVHHGVNSGVISYAATMCVKLSVNHSVQSGLNGSVFVWLRSDRSIQGTLEVSYDHTVSIFTSDSRHLVASTAFVNELFTRSPVRKSWRVVLDRYGVQVGHNSVMGYLQSRANASTTGVLGVRFIPDAWFETYGRRCGPSLSGALDGLGQVAFESQGLATSGAAAGLFFGLSQTADRFPGSSCLLYNDRLVFVPLLPGSSGSAIVRVNKPGGAVSAYAQVLEWSAAQQSLRASEGLRFELR